MVRDRTRGWLARRSLKLAATACLFSAWMLSHAVYYNELKSLEFQVHGCRAQIRAQEQRRHHIRQALVAISQNYTRYEEKLLGDLTALRTGASSTAIPREAPVGPDASAASPAVQQPPELRELLSKLRIVAEQYPDLKLSQNLQQLSQSVVECETDIAAKIMAYNDAVNRYTTVLYTFPGNIFGALSGFPAYEFYQVDAARSQYQEVVF
jgi:LemA protein